MLPGAAPVAAPALRAATGAQELTTASGAAFPLEAFLLELLAWGSLPGYAAGPAIPDSAEESSERADLLIRAGVGAAAALPAGERSEAPEDARLRATFLSTPPLAAVAAAPPWPEVPSATTALVGPRGAARLFEAPSAVASGESHAAWPLRSRPGFAEAPTLGPAKSSPPAAPAQSIQAPHPAIQQADALPASAQLALSARAGLREAANVRGELALTMEVTQKAPAQPLDASCAPEAAVPEVTNTGEGSLREEGLPTAGGAHRPARAHLPAREPEPTRPAPGELRSISPHFGAAGDPQGEPVRPVPATAAASTSDSGLSGLRGEAPPLARPSVVSDPAPAFPFEGSPAVVCRDAPRMASPSPVRRIELRLASRPAEAFTVQVAERGGRIELELRTPDRDLATSLTERASEIVRRLETAGFRAQAFTPQSPPRALETASELPLQNGTEFRHHRDDGGRGGAGRHPNEQHQRDSDPDAPLKPFSSPDWDPQEVDS